jgi:hypothetical protein
MKPGGYLNPPGIMTAEPLGGPTLDKNTTPPPPGQGDRFWLAISLLAVITNRAGHTFSWYTSKKGRIWATLKGFRPIQYSTSIELDSSLSDSQLFDALNVLYYVHMPKMRGEVPPLPTWITRKDVLTQVSKALVYNEDMFNRWQAGEILWEETDGTSWQDAKETGLESPG